MSNVNHVNTVQVGKGNDVAAAGIPLSSLEEGQLALVDAKTLSPLDVTGAQGLSPRASVFIVRGDGGGEFSLSSIIKGDDVKNYGGTPNEEQVFMTWSQSLPEIFDEREYRYTVLIKDDQRPHGQKQTREVYNYKTGIGASAADVLFGLNELFWTRKQNASEKKYMGRFVTQYIAGDFAATGLTAAAADGAFVKGSKYVTFSGGAGATFVAGNYIKVDGYVDINGTSSIAWFKIDSVDGDLVKLTTPWSGETATIAAASVEATDQAGVDAATTSDLSFVVVAQDPMSQWNKIDEFELVMFETSIGVVANAGGVIDNAIPAGESEMTAFTAPAGRGYQVYDMVFHAQGYKGVNSRNRWFDSNINPVNEADVNALYDIASIGFDTKYRKDFQDVGLAPKSAQLAFVKDAPQSTGFVDILNGWFSDVLGFDAISL